MNLFDVPKIPVYCDGITHRLETRKSGETKVVDLTLKVQPFNGQLASALDQSEYGFVKRVLFKMDSGDPTVDLRAAEFTPPGDRQRLTCFATTDSDEPSIVIDQVRVTKLRARRGKESNGWTLYIGVSFGPLDRNELEYVNRFYTNQAWITWEEAEQSLDFDSDDDEPEEDDAATPLRPAPMWDDNDTPSAVDLQSLMFALLGKQCFLEEEQLAALSADQRAALAFWATAKRAGRPPVLDTAHVAGAANTDGVQVCAKCGLVLKDGGPDQQSTYVEKSLIGLDCPGVDLEDARPVSKRGAKSKARRDPEGEASQQRTEGRKRGQEGDDAEARP